MKFLKSLFSAFCIFIILFTFSCSTVKHNVKSPKFKVSSSILSKGIDDKDYKGIPIDPTTSFTVKDQAVVSSIKVKNLSGQHMIRWDWLRPDGELYFSTGNSQIKSEQGKYHKETSVWHKLLLQGDSAADYPGDWHVNIYFDDQLVAFNKFNLKTEIKIDKTVMLTKEPNLKKWGLIIGIEKYSELPEVKFVERDTLLVKECFMKIMGVPEENIIYLLNSDATKSRIEGYIKDYLPMNVSKDTILYVYFAGHGIASLKDQDAYIVPYDGDLKFIDRTGYKLQKFYADLNSLNIKRSVIFIDGCFSGVTRSKEMLLSGARPALIHANKIKLSSNKVISICASQGGQISNAYPEKKHGLFTYFLTEGLNGSADTDSNKKIDIKELYTYLKVNVNKISRRMGVEQTPVIIPSVERLKGVIVN